MQSNLASQQSSFDLTPFDIFDHIENISLSASNSLTQREKREFAAYYTPRSLSEHMVTVADFKGGKLGDKGAGAGVLSASAAAKHILSNSKVPCFISANEIQPAIQQFLKKTLNSVAQQAKALNKTFDYEINGDFLEMADTALSNECGDYDSLIINPPYFKIAAKSDINTLIFNKLGFRLPNIYSVFILLSLRILKKNGSLTALVPRSFFNGAYHKPFRNFIRQNFSIDSVTRYRSRSNLFKGDNVLQENVIIKFSKRKQAELISIFTCDEPNKPAEHNMLLPASLLLDNEEGIFVLPADHEELSAFQRVRQLPFSLSDLGVSFSTGKLIAYKQKEFFTDEEGAMFVEAKNIDTSTSHYKRRNNPRSHGDAVTINTKTKMSLIDAQNVILIKRISSNSDTKRMHCTVLKESDCNTKKLAIANSLQYIYGPSIADENVALRLNEFLTSPDVENAIRAINGTTQINSGDVNMLRFPSNIL